jgi:bacteriocin-like protein
MDNTKKPENKKNIKKLTIDDLKEISGGNAIIAPAKYDVEAFGGKRIAE